MSWNGEMYSPPEFSGKKQHFHCGKKNKMQENANKNVCSTTADVYRRSMHIFAAAHKVHNAKRKNIHTHKHTRTQRIEGDALTEKHPVLLGVWPAALLSGEAHVCCCCVSGLSTGSGARTSCCCCCWLTDWSTGCWQAVAERVSRCALCLSRGIETRQLLACDMGGWSVCVSVLLTLLIVPLLQSLRRWEQTHFLEKLMFAQIRGLWVILYYCTWSDLVFFLSPSGKLQLFRALFRQKQMDMTGVSCKPITEAGLCGMPLLWLLASWITLQLFDNTLMGPIFGNITN